MTDITYIRTAQHWLYRCIVLDLYSGLVVGWSMRARQDRQLVVQVVLMAWWQRPARPRSFCTRIGGANVRRRNTNDSWRPIS